PCWICSPPTPGTGGMGGLRSPSRTPHRTLRGESTMAFVDDLDRLWRRVRAHPEQVDALVQAVFALPLDVTEAGARDLLTHQYSPSDRLALDASAADYYLRREARDTAGARP